MRNLRNYIFKLLIVLAIFEIWMIQSLVAQDPDVPRKRNELGFRLPEGKHQHNIPFELIDNLIVVKIVLNARVGMAKWITQRHTGRSLF